VSTRDDIRNRFVAQAVMTYNVGFFVAIVAGYGIGHYMCADMRSGKAGGGDACCPQP
jgi:hypothetical protein